ncbi:MAG TPA: protein kinase [Pyrinomonadaceae bacterium]|jgi:serine/threonine protein kinase/Tol biopolymer transport system component
MLTGNQYGRYEIRELLGAGGMGEVYLAHDAQLDRAVALKILSAEFLVDPERQSRFRQEARAASALNHPNIITIYEIGENDSGSFLATEFIKGETLREFINRKSLSTIQILKIAEQIANALIAAHAAHIVHRDIKPENIMVRQDSIVKVLDFGLAKPVAHDFSDEKGLDDLIKTQPGMVMGSVRYMSPEQARGLEVDERTDIWSLGVVLYEMLTGKPPFDGATASDTIAAVLCKEPVSLLYFVPEAPAELQRIIRKSLQKDREERYQNIKDFALDLKSLIYELEHQTSAERMRQLSDRINISENPTMIHRTADANYPTTAVNVTTGRNGSVANSGKPKIWRTALISLLALVVLAGLSFGFYRLFAERPGIAATAFDKIQVSGINTDGKTAAPAISPDGKYIAYLSGEVGSRSLAVRQVSTDSSVTIIQPTTANLFGITFSPDGDYIYYLQTSEDFVLNTLYRIPTLGGTPKKLIEDVDSTVTFSPDGKQIAFQRNVSKEAIVIIYTANVDGSNVQPLIRSDETGYNIIGSPKWSPDGSTILVRAFNNFGGTVEKMEIAEISLAEKKLKVFGRREWAAVYEFNWFKDGSGFLFTAQDSLNSPVQIWRATYPRGEFHPVTNDINNYNSLNLSADGKTIITLKSNASSSIWNFDPTNKHLSQITPESQTQEGSFGLAQLPDGKIIHSRKMGNSASLWVMDADTSNARSLTTEIKSFINSPTSTPDGRYIVFSSKHSGSPRIWRMDADGKNLKQLTKEKPNYGDFAPQITSDGKWIVYYEYASGANADTSLMKVSIDGGESSVLYHDEQYNISNHIISPDGKFIAYNSYRKSDYDKKIRIASLKDNALGQVVKEFDADLINSYVWSPDGKSLTFSSNRNGATNLWQLFLDGAPSRPLTDFKSGRIFNYIWSANGKNLFVVRGNVNSDLILIQDN